MSSGGIGAPPSIDYNSLAQSQGAANQQAANLSSILSNYNTSSPFGTSNFSQGSNGQWNLSQILSPQGQSLFNSQQGLAGNLANTGNSLASLFGGEAGAGSGLLGSLGGLASGLPTGALNFNGLTPLPTSATDFGNAVTSARDAAYNQQEAYLRPQQAEQSSDFAQQMADQGINPGTAAYDRAYGDLSRGQTFANQQAQDAAVAAGNQEQQALFGENLSSRQQGANEALQSYQSLPNLISELAGAGGGLLSGGASGLGGLGSLANFGWAAGIPTYGGGPTTVQPANYAQAAQAANQANLGRFYAGNTLNNQLFNGIGSLGGAVGNAFGLGSGWLSNLIGGGGGFGGSGSLAFLQ